MQAAHEIIAGARVKFANRGARSTHRLGVTHHTKHITPIGYIDTEILFNLLDVGIELPAQAHQPRIIERLEGKSRRGWSRLQCRFMGEYDY